MASSGDGSERFTKTFVSPLSRSVNDEFQRLIKHMARVGVNDVEIKDAQGKLCRGSIDFDGYIRDNDNKNEVREILGENAGTGKFPIVITLPVAATTMNGHPQEIDAAIAILEALGAEAAGGTAKKELDNLRNDRSMYDNSGQGISVKELLDHEGHIILFKYNSSGLKGVMSNALGSLQMLKHIELYGNELTGSIPDLSACTQLSTVRLHDNDLEGSLPAKWPSSLRVLDISENKRLSGHISASLILQCNEIDYSSCQQRWDAKSGKTNCEWMSGPFIVGVSFASEDIAALTYNRQEFAIIGTMLIDPPSRGCIDYDMETTHGPSWVAWQEVWLAGLRKLENRHVIVVACAPWMNSFKLKFQRSTTDEHNRTNCFDARYELPAGDRAECILDWERRHIAICAAQNNLKIWFIQGNYDAVRQEKPDWYELPEGFARKEGGQCHAGQAVYYEWTREPKAKVYEKNRSPNDPVQCRCAMQ